MASRSERAREPASPMARAVATGMYMLAFGSFCFGVGHGVISYELTEQARAHHAEENDTQARAVITVADEERDAMYDRAVDFSVYALLAQLALRRRIKGSPLPGA